MRTVRGCTYAMLAFEVTDVMLADGDMWDVCSVEWPVGKVGMHTNASGQYKIIPIYYNPHFFQ